MAPGGVPMADVVRAAAAELDVLAARCHRLQIELGPALTAGGPDVQDLDAVTQRLGALALFFSELAARTPADWTADAAAAARGLPLADLADALTLRPRRGAETVGELDLF